MCPVLRELIQSLASISPLADLAVGVASDHHLTQRASHSTAVSWLVIVADSTASMDIARTQVRGRISTCDNQHKVSAPSGVQIPCLSSWDRQGVPTAVLTAVFGDSDVLTWVTPLAGRGYPTRVFPTRNPVTSQ